MDVVIVGAGTFGASLAWSLARRGDEVTLVDQFEPGDRRATSGGETRLIRCAHGDDADYTAMARRARTLWRELEAETGDELLVECGIAWFAHGEDGWEADSMRRMADQGIPVERLDPAGAERLFPSLGTGDLAWVLYEPEAGVLRAQRAVQALAARRAGARRDARAGPRDARRAAPRGCPTARGSRATRSSGPAGAGSAACSASSPRCASPARSSSSSTAAPAWAQPRRPAGSTTTARCTARPTSTGSASRSRSTPRAPRSIPTTSCPPGGRRPSGRARLRRRALPGAGRRPAHETRTCRYELSPDSNFIAAEHPEQAGRVAASAAAPATASSTAPRWPSASPRAARRAALPARFGVGARAAGRSLRTAGSGA